MTVEKIYVSRCGLMELRLGDYREVLDDVRECQSVITDPPYSERVHNGQTAKLSDGETITQLHYAHFSDEHVKELVLFASKRITSWCCAMSDHVLIPSYQSHYDAHDLYFFQPLPCVTIGGTIRLSGDGPSSWSIYLNCARTRKAHRWGTLPGAYVEQRTNPNHPDRCRFIGGKTITLMRKIVRDYSTKGSLVVDPCAGSGTTLLACAIEGRRCIGAEIDGETYEKAIKRLEKGYTPLLLE